MRVQSTIGLLAGLLTASSAVSSAVVGFAPVAQACGSQSLIATATADPQANPQVNLRLGMAEETLVQTFGPPQERFRERVRCPSNRINLAYAQSLIVLSPPAELNQAAPAAPNQPANNQPAPNQPLVVIGFTSADPSVVIEGGIHVGLSEVAATEKLAQACDRGSLRQTQFKATTIFNCQVANQPVRLRITHAQVSQITVGEIYPRYQEY
jgi:hypothetical protein